MRSSSGWWAPAPPRTAQLSDTELLARVIKGESSQIVRQKTLMLTALFKEAGDLGMMEERPEEGRAFYLRALHLMLNALVLDKPFECPDFVPRVEALLAPLQDAPLPLETQARLMRHYERIGEFAKAEDWLFAMLEAQPGNRELVGFGVCFYERLKRQSNATLSAGNLPRTEIEAGLAELRGR